MRTASNSLPCVRAFARVLLATVVVGLGLAAASLLRPASTEAADPIWACYSNSNFSLRTVAGPSACAGGETAVRLDDSENPIWICLHPQPGHIRFAGPADADPITGNCWGAGSTQYFQAPGENAVTLCVQPSNGILSYPPCGPNQTQLVIPPRQRAPVAADQSVSTNEDTPKVITLSATDADDDNLTFSIVDQPAHGTLGSLGAPDCSAANVCTATVTYTPDTDYFGSDSFTFNANDGDADSNVATVSITINPVNDAPTDIALDNASVPENQPGGTLVGTFSTTDADPGDTFTYTLVGGAGSDDNGDFQIAGNQLVTDHGLNFEADPERTIRVRSTD
ncbi:MAG TPA: Ig-like domain-containing protein, partial [Thermomicrobiales bacterium]